MRAFAWEHSLAGERPLVTWGGRPWRLGERSAEDLTPSCLQGRSRGVSLLMGCLSALSIWSEWWVVVLVVVCLGGKERLTASTLFRPGCRAITTLCMVSHC